MDSDCDGITSSALFYNYLKERLKQYDNEIIYHIPEGKEHGLDSLLDWFPENGEDSLIVVPDGGSNDFKEHAILRARGYDILVLDHHEAEKYSEDAIVINNQLSKNYPNKFLSGVGIVYKFFECYEDLNEWSDFSIEYLDIVALGLIGDMMEMNNLENRWILTYGLSHIQNEFFQTLVDKQAYSLKGELNQIGVAFYIVPLINSIIRLGTLQDKEHLFEAFIKKDKILPSTKRGAAPGDTETICEYMARICVNTKNKQNKVRDKALELLDIQITNNCLDENKIIVLDAEDLDIPKTMTGLCAMGVVSKYKKPCLLGRVNEEGEMKGSARGVNGSELTDFKAFLDNSKLTTEVAGHANAFGYALKESNIDKLVKYANETLKDINFNEGFYEVDFDVNGNCSYLKTMIQELTEGGEYWGQGCPEPLIYVKNINIDSSDISIKGQNTVAFKFNDIEYIKFKDDELADLVNSFNGKININIVGHPQINEWMGRTTNQIRIEAIEINESNIYDF